MRKYLLPFLLLPNAVFAHGGHTPMPETAHTVYHGIVYAGLGVVFFLLLGILIYKVSSR